jgi:hypothetical protein
MSALGWLEYKLRNAPVSQAVYDSFSKSESDAEKRWGTPNWLQRKSAAANHNGWGRVDRDEHVLGSWESARNNGYLATMLYPQAHEFYQVRDDRRKLRHSAADVGNNLIGILTAIAGVEDYKKARLISALFGINSEANDRERRRKRNRRKEK